MKIITIKLAIELKFEIKILENYNIKQNDIYIQNIKNYINNYINYI